MSDSLLLIINKADLQISEDFQGILGCSALKEALNSLKLPVEVENARFSMDFQRFLLFVLFLNGDDVMRSLAVAAHFKLLCQVSGGEMMPMEA